MEEPYMIRKRVVSFAVVLSVCAAVCSAQARTLLVFGPRVGMMYIFGDWAGFDSGMQVIFPDADRTYYPFMTHFGVNFEQRIRLGGTSSHFAFQEVLTFGGLDQNVVLPSLNTLIGFRSHAGLEFGLGPNFSLVNDGGAIGLGVSVVYAVGWTFSFRDVYVPVDIAVVPTPKDGRPRLTIMTGFNFDLTK